MATDYSDQWTRKDGSDAQAHVKRHQREDGGIFDWLHDEDGNPRPGLPNPERFGEWTRHTFDDGSSIVAGDAWDYGVHDHVFREAEALIWRVGEQGAEELPPADTIWPEAYHIFAVTRPGDVEVE